MQGFWTGLRNWSTRLAADDRILTREPAPSLQRVDCVLARFARHNKQAMRKEYFLRGAAAPYRQRIYIRTIPLRHGLMRLTTSGFFCLVTQQRHCLHHIGAIAGSDFEQLLWNNLPAKRRRFDSMYGLHEDATIATPKP